MGFEFLCRCWLPVLPPLLDILNWRKASVDCHMDSFHATADELAGATYQVSIVRAGIGEGIVTIAVLAPIVTTVYFVALQIAMLSKIGRRI